MTYETTVTMKVTTERPIPEQRMRSWIRGGLNFRAISLHEDGPHIPGDPAAGEDGWEYRAKVGLIEVARSVEVA